MMKRLLIFLMLTVAAFAQDTGGGGGSGQGFVYTGVLASIPATCTLGTIAFITNAAAGQQIYECSATNTWTQQLNSGAGGASTALDNLASVNINTALLFQATKDIGSAAKPAQFLWLYGAGTYGTTSVKVTGTPTGARVWTVQDVSDTFVGLATTDILTNKTLTTPTIGSFTNATHNHTNVAGGGTLTLAGAAFANQGTTTTLLHGNAAGNPLFAAVNLASGGDITGILTSANGGTGTGSTLTGVVRGGSPLTASELSGAVTTSASNVTSPGKADVLDAVNFCTDAVGTDAYACNLAPAISAYVTGTHYRFKAGTANTGVATIALNGLTATTIKKVAGGITTDLADNDIRLGQWVDLVYDGTNMQMQSTLGNAASGSGTVTVVGAGSLTSTAIVTGGGTTTLQTPSATSTMDSSGNISTPGSVTAASFITTGSSADLFTAISDPACTSTPAFWFSTTTAGRFKGCDASSNIRTFMYTADVLSSAQMPTLTGDVSNSGLTVTVSKVNGVSHAASPSTDTVEVITAANTATAKAIPNCTDTGGNHLNYTASTHALSCGTSSSGGGAGSSRIYSAYNQSDTSLNGVTSGSFVDLTGSSGTILANSMGSNGCARVTLYTVSAGSTTKNYKVSYGGGTFTLVFGGTGTSDLNAQFLICSANSTSSQNLLSQVIWLGSSNQGMFSALTAAADSTTNQTLKITVGAQGGTGGVGDTVTLKSMLVELIP